MKMKVRDLFDIHVSGDVYENVAECIGVYYETDAKLTKAGRERFKRALDVPVEKIGNGYIIIDTEGHAKAKGINLDGYTFDGDDVPAFVQDLIDLFWSLAGYCGESEYAEWFEIDDE